MGGSDIDLCLFKILKDRIFQATGVDIATTTVSPQSGADCQQDAAASANLCTAAAVHTMAEDVKKALTYHSEVPFNCTMPSTSKTAGAAYAPKSVSFMVRREEDLEQGCGALFERSMLPVQRLLDTLGE